MTLTEIKLKNGSTIAVKETGEDNLRGKNADLLYLNIPLPQVHFPDVESLFDHLFEAKCNDSYAETQAYAELTRDYEGKHARVRDYVKEGPGEHVVQEPFSWKKGQTVRVVMVSRLGDLGITDELDKTHGYKARIPMNSDLLTNCRLER